MPTATSRATHLIKSVALTVPMAAGLGMTASFLMMAEDLRQAPALQHAALSDADFGKITFLGQPPKTADTSPGTPFRTDSRADISGGIVTDPRGDG
ncbi:MAG: hypothetical protein AAGE03_00135 [Pseudomonadota bacterium]